MTRSIKDRLASLAAWERLYEQIEALPWPGDAPRAKDLVDSFARLLDVEAKYKVLAGEARLLEAGWWRCENANGIVVWAGPEEPGWSCDLETALTSLAISRGEYL